MRTIKTIEEKYLTPTLDLVEQVFTAHSDAEEGALVRALVEEIRSKRFYLPALELVMVDENDSPIGYCNFSRFHLNGKYEDELLLLSPVAVKTLGYRAVIVEGNPRNYRSRGFLTSADFGITAHESVGLPAPECLMVKALVPGGLEGIQGQVCYSDYECLR